MSTESQPTPHTPVCLSLFSMFQVVSNGLDTKLRDNLERMKKIRSAERTTPRAATISLPTVEAECIGIVGDINARARWTRGSCCALFAALLCLCVVQPAPRSASLLGNPRARTAHQDHRPPRQGRWPRCQVNGSLSASFIAFFALQLIHSAFCWSPSRKEFPLKQQTIESHAIALVL